MSIKAEIFTKELELTETIENYINKKTQKIERFLDEIEDIRVDISYSKTARDISDRYIAQITLHGPGFVLRAEERSNELYSAFDLVMEKIQRQIERYKGKRDRTQTSAKSIKEVFSESENTEAPSPQLSEIVRRKKFKLTPMDEIEAIEQMKLLGHEDFFVFFNMKTNSINILYRRRDGNFGIIEPIME